MSIHIAAKAGQIADKVLLPGDPLRAKFAAENFLENAELYNNVRGMLGFTGLYRGVRVSIQGTGMGQPSMSIYADELFREYGVMKAIRIGTAGAIQPHLELRSVVLAMAASTDSGINRNRFNGLSFAPSCSWELLKAAYDCAINRGTHIEIGSVASSDIFYDDNNTWKLWQKYGVLAVEMETAELYTLAAKYGRKALSILTISDSLITKAQTSAEERQTSFSAMVKLALDTIIA